MTDPQLQIRNRIKRIAKNKKRRRVSPGPQLRAQDVHIPEEDKPGFFAIFLITCVFLLFVATLGMMFIKDGGFDFNALIASEEVAEQRETNVEVTTPPPAVVAPKPDKMDARVSQLEKDMRVFEHRVWLLGLATNENANLSKKMDTAHHRVDDRGFVTFDKDWKLSKVPETMQLTEDQRQRLMNGPPK